MLMKLDSGQEHCTLLMPATLGVLAYHRNPRVCGEAPEETIATVSVPGE